MGGKTDPGLGRSPTGERERDDKLYLYSLKCLYAHYKLPDHKDPFLETRVVIYLPHLLIAEGNPKYIPKCLHSRKTKL